MRFESTLTVRSRVCIGITEEQKQPTPWNSHCALISKSCDKVGTLRLPNAPSSCLSKLLSQLPETTQPQKAYKP